jgi:UDP-glucose 4-epimerase
MAARKVLVTGGAGFIASHVADAYIARGDRVWVLDDLSSGREANIPKQAEFVHASVTDASVPELFKKVGGFDIVNHHAAQIDVRKSVADPRLDADINLGGLLNLLQSCLATGVQRFVFVSSGGVVYGEADVRPTSETAPKQPMSPYGVTKLASELYLHYYYKVHAIDYAALRYSNVYGPRQNPHGEAGVVAIFSTRLIDRQPITIYGDGEQTRDYVFVSDVVTANMAVTDAPLADTDGLDQRAFNVGTGVETSVNELAAALARAAGVEPEIQFAPARSGELNRSALDTSRLRTLGWKPAHSLNEGLSTTYEFIRNGERGW